MSLQPEDVVAVPGDAAGGVNYLEEAVDEWQHLLATSRPAFLLEHSNNTWPGAIDGQFPMVGASVFMFQLLVECCSHVSATGESYLRAIPTSSVRGDMRWQAAQAPATRPRAERPSLCCARPRFGRAFCSARRDLNRLIVQ